VQVGPDPLGELQRPPDSLAVIREREGWEEENNREGKKGRQGKDVKG